MPNPIFNINTWLALDKESRTYAGLYRFRFSNKREYDVDFKYKTICFDYMRPARWKKYYV